MAEKKTNAAKEENKVLNAPEVETEVKTEDAQEPETPMADEVGEASNGDGASEKPEKRTDSDYDPWKDEREIYIPKSDSKDLNYEILSVNGIAFKVQRGRRVKVPYPIYEVWKHSQTEQEKADEYIDEKLSE